MTTQTDANGVTTTNIYDPTRLYRLQSTVTADTPGRDTILCLGVEVEGMVSIHSTYSLAVRSIRLTNIIWRARQR